MAGCDAGSAGEIVTPQHGQTGRRPRPVTIVGWLFIAAGGVGFGYHARELVTQRPVAHDLIWVLAVRLLAVIGGVFALRGHDWARWLLVAWLGYHVALGALHSASEALVHAVLLVVVGYLLLGPPATAYFRPRAGVARGE